MPRLKPARLLLIFLTLVYFVYFGLYAHQRHLAFETGAFDLGVYAQPLWNFNQGRGLALSMIEDIGPVRWATHVEPILFLVAPLYRLWPHPATLLWLQVAWLSLSALPLYVLAVRRLHSEWTALVIVAAYFLMPATEAVTLFDFHAVTLAPLLLLSAIYFLDRALERQGQSFWLWPEKKQPTNGSTSQRHTQPYSLLLTAYFLFLLAMSTKEDISLYVVMIGLYLLALRRRWRESLTLMVSGAAWFYVASQVIIPAYRTGGGHSVFLAWFETLGRTPVEVALSPFTKPDQVVALFLRPGSLSALGMLTIPQALLPLLGLPVLIMAAPGLAFSFLSENPTLRQLETWHYAAPMLPFIMLAVIDGLARAAWLGQKLSIRYQVSGVKYYVLRITYYVLRFTRPILTLLLLLTALTYHILRGYSHLSLLNEWPEVTPHHALGREMAASIPADASVLAQAQLIPAIAHRPRLLIWDGPFNTAYDYIWFDLSHPKLPNRFNAHGDLLTGLVIEKAFGPVAAKDGYLLLKKGAPRNAAADEFFSFTYFDQLPAGVQPFKAAFGDTFKLVGVKTEVRRLATSETEPQVVLYFNVLQAPGDDYRLFVYLVDEQGQIVGATDYPQPALFWQPTSRWAAGDQRQVRVNTIPWWSGDKTTFSYALGFSRSDNPWDVSARLPLTLTDAGFPPLDNGTLLPIAAFRRFGGLVYPVGIQSVSASQK